jgi:hypothetical protein
VSRGLKREVDTDSFTLLDRMLIAEQKSRNEFCILAGTCSKACGRSGCCFRVGLTAGAELTGCHPRGRGFQAKA